MNEAETIKRLAWDADLAAGGFWEGDDHPPFSPETKALVDRLLTDERFDGGTSDDPTPREMKPDHERWRRYYPAFCAAEHSHLAAKLWALVAHLERAGEQKHIIAEVEAMARYFYDHGWAWEYAAMSGDPKYDDWLAPDAAMEERVRRETQ